MNKLQQLKEQIKEASNQIEEIQSQCNHPKASLTVEHKSDTGNYDPSADCYWTKYHCGLCEKGWVEEQ